MKAPSEDGIHVSLGVPIAFGGEKGRDLLLAGALGARAGTRDPVDLELLETLCVGDITTEFVLYRQPETDKTVYGSGKSGDRRRLDLGCG